MNILVELFRCFLIFVLAFSLKVKASRARGIQQLNWNEGSIEGDRNATTKENAFPTEKLPEKPASKPRNQRPEPPCDGHTTQEINFRNFPLHEAENTDLSGNAPEPSEDTKDTPDSSNAENLSKSVSISLGWGSMIPPEVKKEHDDRFHRLLCVSDCKMATLMTFNMQNQSNPFLNMQLPGRPYTYRTLIDWCRENCGGDRSWVRPTTTTPVVTSLPEVGYQRPRNHKRPFFEPKRMSLWQQTYPTMTNRPFLQLDAKPSMYQPVHSVLPTIIIPPMAVTKPNFFSYSNVIEPSLLPPPTPVMFRDATGEIMNSPGTIGMSFRIKGSPFFAGTILKRPLTGRSNTASGGYNRDISQWINHEPSGRETYNEEVCGRTELFAKIHGKVHPHTEAGPDITTKKDDRKHSEEDDHARKGFEETHQNDEDEDDDSEDVATTIFHIMRDVYRLIRNKGVRTLLNILFCDEESNTEVIHNPTRRGNPDGKVM